MAHDEFDDEFPDDLIGSKPEHGEDPRFADGEGVVLSSNGAFTEIEDFDHFDTVDVELDPYIVRAADDDGFPGFHPYADASNAFSAADGVVHEHDDETFEQKEGLEAHPEAADSPDSDVLGDEFVDRLHRREAASVDELGRSRGDLAMLTHASNAAQEQNNAIAKHVRINPPSAYTALMGGSAPVTSGGPSVEVGRWEGGSDIESQPVSIAFARVSPNPSTINGPEAGLLRPFRPYGIVQWGTRNAAISCEVDIGAGTQFTIAATAVNIQVAMDDNLRLVPFTPPGTLLLAGQLSFWTIMRTAPITRTLYYDLQAVELTTDFPVPSFAKKLWLLRSDSTQPVQLFFEDSQTNVVYDFTLAAGAFQTQPIILTDDIYFIHVQSLAGNLNEFRLCFELSL